jgi:hypothetical protein
MKWNELGYNEYDYGEITEDPKGIQVKPANDT